MRIGMRGIVKRFGPLAANDGIDLDVAPGEVVALLGENGAGKSTLMKILYGMQPPDAGEILVDGVPRRFASPRQAQDAGIAMVFQQFSLAPSLSVRENLLLAAARAPWYLGHRGRAVPAARGLGRLHEIAPGVRPEQVVADLPVGQMQQVELTKALNRQPRLLILDEPSAVLTPAQATELWALVRRLAASGMGAVLITHKLDDVAACADRVVVLRQGRLAGSCSAQAGTAELTRLMMGEAPAPTTRVCQPHPASADHATPTPPRLRAEVRGLEAAGLHGISLRVAAGEILGIAGVSGNGQDQLADACAGLLPLRAGEVIVDGELVAAPRRPAQQPPSIGYLPERPLARAVGAALPAWLNLHLRELARMPAWPDQTRLAHTARQRMQAADVRPADPALPAAGFSGGNLQKLVAEREFSGSLAGSLAFVVACYPGMGLDLAAAASVRRQLVGLAEAGSAVLWIGEDLDELLAHADRLAVMVGGRLVATLPTAGADRLQIGALMAGKGGTATPHASQQTAGAWA